MDPQSVKSAGGLMPGEHSDKMKGEWMSIDDRNNDSAMMAVDGEEKFYTDHTRNCTGISGPRLWSDDEEVNRLWDKYGKPIPNGTSVLS